MLNIIRRDVTVSRPGQMKRRPESIAAITLFIQPSTKRVRRFERPTFTLATCKPELQSPENKTLTDAPPNAYTEAYIENPDSVQIDPDLVLICERWEALPEAVKIGIAAMVEAAVGAVSPHPPSGV